MVEELQKLSADELISLYELDTTAVLGDEGAVLRFCNERADGAGLTWRGNLYSKIAINVEGFEVRSSGSLPSPNISVNNILGTLSARNLGLSNLIGMKFTRYRMFRKYLDDGSSPSNDSFYGPDVFFVERKTASNKVFVSWQLRSPLDLQGISYPLKRVTKDVFPGVAKIRR